MIFPSLLYDEALKFSACAQIKHYYLVTEGEANEREFSLS